MTGFVDVFGNNTVPPSEYGYQALSISANTTVYWPYNATGVTVLSKLIDLTATIGGLSITLPDATQVSTGEDFLIRNVGSNAVSIKKSDGTAVATVNAGAATYFYLTDNTTAAGTFGVISYGVGTSSVDAASLVGYGIIASGATLNQSHPVFTTATAPTVGVTHRAGLINYTGGSATLALTSAATLGDNFFTLVRNSGTGTLTIDPAASETIDGQTNLGIQPGESLLLFCSGTAWYSVGYGRSVQYNFTQLVKDVTAAGTFTLSAAEASNKLLTFIGSPASAVTIVVPNTVSVYYTLSSISTAQTITIKTAAGTGTGVTQGARVIAICDSTNVYSAQSVAATTNLSLVDGSSTTPALNFASQTNTGLFKYSSTGIGLAVAGVARFTDDGTTTTIGSLTGVPYRTAGAESVATGTQLVAAPTAAATSKATPVDADVLPLVDSAASNGLKKLTIANLKTLIFSAWGTLIGAGTAKTTPVDADAIAIMDSAASNATKRLTLANLKSWMLKFVSANVASAATVDLTNSIGKTVHITGTTGISTFTMLSGQVIDLIFDGILTLTYHATNNNLPGAANITTAAGDRARYFYDGTTVYCLIYQKADGSAVVATASSPQIITVPVPTFSGGAMTIPGVTLSLDFRSTTLGSGTVTRVTGTPANLVISSGSTLGTVNGLQSDIAVLAINNAGTIELAAVNVAGGVDLSETSLISTTAEGGAGAADSATVIYSTTARTNVAYRVIGIIRSTQAIAGTWATSPSLIQGEGGEFNIGKKLYPSGSAPVYGVRAWCAFNGTTTGTNAPLAGGNVTSVTRNSQGNYTINFTTPMPSANYAMSSMCNIGYGSAFLNGRSESQLSIITANTAGSATDANYIAVQVVA